MWAFHKTSCLQGRIWPNNLQAWEQNLLFQLEMRLNWSVSRNNCLVCDFIDLSCIKPVLDLLVTLWLIWPLLVYLLAFDKCGCENRKICTRWGDDFTFGFVIWRREAWRGCTESWIFFQWCWSGLYDPQRSIWAPCEFLLFVGICQVDFLVTNTSG